jgi:protein phosphatase
MPFDTVHNSFSLEVAGITDVGCVRANNEDNFGYDAALGVFVLCDGMGGETAGEVASEISVNTVLSYFRQAVAKGEYPVLELIDDVSTDANALGNAIRAANRAIRDAVAADAGQNGMGTTIVAALVRGCNLAIAHVGDSRIYLIRNNTIEQLTNDHSLVMEQVRRGLMTLEQAEHSPIQNIITRALGTSEPVEPDLADHALLNQDTLLLCSDGLTRHLPDEQILALVNNSSSIETACNNLIAAAKAAGGSDNVTSLLVRVSSASGSRNPGAQQ